MAAALTNTIKTMSKHQCTISFSEERMEEIDETVEEGNWENRVEYIRHIIRAGESNIAALDPRTSSNRSNTTVSDGETPSDAITDEELLTQLRKKCDTVGDDEYVPADEVIQPFLDDLDNSLSKRLLDLGVEEGTAVETNGKGEYRIKTNR